MTTETERAPVGRSTTRGPNDQWTQRARALVAESVETQRAMHSLTVSLTRSMAAMRRSLCASLGLPEDTPAEALCAKLECLSAEARERGIL